MFAQRAQGAGRRDDDQAIIFVAQGALVEQLRRLGGEPLLLELMKIGLLHRRARGPGAGVDTARRVALLLAVLEAGLAVLALDDQMGEIPVALVAEEKRFLAVGDDDEAVVRNP